MTATPQVSAAPREPKESARLAKAKSARAASGGAAHELLELGKTIFYALLIAFVLRVVLFQPFTIPSESMEPNLLKGDYIIVSKWAYGWSRHSILFSPPIGHGRLLGREPRRGDIIVFKFPHNTAEDYIKRVIGLPGDRVQVVHGQVMLNGKLLPRAPAGQGLEQTAFGQTFPVQQFRETLPSGKSFITYSYGPDGPADNTGVYVVPKNCYFMMGDNRDNSSDSRFDPGDIAAGEAACGWNRDVDRFLPPDLGVGFVPAENLEGRADIILFSWRPGVSLFKPWTWFTEARWGRFFHLLG
jgi:signal peptidase I